VEDALYAFTDCEMSISVNPLVILDNKPQVVPISEIVRHHAGSLVKILRAELELEDRTLRDRLHARTLEQIFVEERIYKEIEERKTQAGVVSAVIEGFKPFAKKIKRKVIEEDVERLLRIPIRRISLYDINKAKKEMEEIRARIKEVAYHLNHLVEYAVGFLDDIRERYGPSYPRGTEIASFGKTDVRAVVQRNLSLRYDDKAGYLGYEVSAGKELFKVSDYDRVLVVRASGVYSVIDVPEKLFVGSGMLFCGFADKESLQQKIFTIVYRNDENQYPYIKRCVIEGYIIGKPYSIVPDKSTVLRLTTRQDVVVQVRYVKNPRLKILEEIFPVADFLVKSVRASGVRLAPKPVQSAKLVSAKSAKASAAASGNGRGRSGASSAGTGKKSSSSGGSSRSGSTGSKKSGGGKGKKKS
jgi:topoisomerase-4 subunit A